MTTTANVGYATCSTTHDIRTFDHVVKRDTELKLK
jgi:hypothetical protein